jgi:hypothetical protein
MIGKANALLFRGKFICHVPLNVVPTLLFSNQKKFRECLEAGVIFMKNMVQYSCMKSVRTKRATTPKIRFDGIK